MLDCPGCFAQLGVCDSVTVWDEIGGLFWCKCCGSFLRGTDLDTYTDNKAFTKVLDVVERIEPVEWQGRSCLWVKMRLPHFPLVKDSVEFTDCPSCQCFEKNIDHETGVVNAYFHLLTSDLQVRYEYDVEEAWKSDS